MFYDDINREINGVIKVDQDTEGIIEQELSKYVFLITIQILLIDRLLIQVYGFLDSLEAVNLTS